MPKTVTILRVFVASPVDVKDEREILEEVIRELNLTLQDNGIQLDLVRWETHTYPSISTDAQAVINEQIADDYDIFLGILWTRFGTPTPRAYSGTEEEFERAYSRWKRDPDGIRIMFYFKNAPLPPDDIDPEQLGRIRAFRGKLGERGTYYRTYDDLEHFQRLARVHLNLQAKDWLKSLEKASEPATGGSELAPSKLKHLEVAESTEIEEGLLDLQERILSEFERATELSSQISEATTELGSKIEKRTQEYTELSLSPFDQRAKLAGFLRISNRTALDMDEFTARLRVEVPLLAESQMRALDAYGKAASLLPDFVSKVETQPAIDRILQPIGGLKRALGSARDAISEFRTTMTRIPRIATQMNRSKRELIKVLDDFLRELDRGLELVLEIERTLAEIAQNFGPRNDPESAN